MSHEEKALDRVYAAESPRELERAYADWAADYDRDTIALGYSLPFVIAGWVARHVPHSDGPLLDAGCGTGLSGPFLKALGYDDLVGLDYSRAMLDLAGQRNAYRELRQAELGTTLPWPDDHFAAFLSSGVFTAGHAPASSLDELVRITRPGGHAIFTVRDLLLDDGGFSDVFRRLEDAGRWRRVEESEPFRAFVLAEPEVKVKAFVFEIG
ncbi:class I SAM-dependent DNA methyltransferase [Neoaquamicrobium sediminum]|uniref:class I SAM-dependent DNA methyltransferase n=1 Tax=Neoaquamicrobium sediminum TaxID=1849104 RepID=UPI003BAD1462